MLGEEKGVGTWVSVDGRGMKERDLGLGWGYRPLGVGVQHWKVSVPLSPQTDAVFATLLARNLVREEPAAVCVEAGLCAARELGEGPHDRPLPLGSPGDSRWTTEHILNVVPAEENLRLQLGQRLRLRSGVVCKLLHLTIIKKRATFSLLALQVGLKNLLEEPVVAGREVRAPRRPLDCPPVAAKVSAHQAGNHPALELVGQVLEDLQRMSDSYHKRLNAIDILALALGVVWQLAPS